MGYRVRRNDDGLAGSGVGLIVRLDSRLRGNDGVLARMTGMTGMTGTLGVERVSGSVK